MRSIATDGKAATNIATHHKALSAVLLSSALLSPSLTWLQVGLYFHNGEALPGPIVGHTIGDAASAAAVDMAIVAEADVAVVERIVQGNFTVADVDHGEALPCPDIWRRKKVSSLDGARLGTGVGNTIPKLAPRAES